MNKTASTEEIGKEQIHSEAVREMFAGIAGKYDFLNHFLSANIDKKWRKTVAAKLGDVLDKKGALVLDVACGTGDLSIELQKSGKATIFGTDFCRPMLDIANRKNDENRLLIPYTEADGMNLSFADETFDAVTIAFGLRNFSNWQKGLNELHRITKKGGKLAILEFSTPTVPGFKKLFDFYFSHILPKIGGAISGSPGAYQYLPDSVSKFPDQKKLAAMMRETGFQKVEFKNLTYGIAAIHIGEKV